MYLKKKISLLFVCIVVIIVGITTVACKPLKVVDLNELAEMDFSTLSKVDGLDSWDLMQEAHNNFRESKNYKYIIDLYFSAETLGIKNTQRSQETIYRNENDAFYSQVRIGSGMGKMNYARQIYITDEGESGKMKLIEDDAKKVNPNKDDRILNVDMSDISWETIDSQEDRETKYRSYTHKINPYNLERDKMADSHDNNVYEKNGIYYFSVTIRTKGTEKDGTQDACKKEIEDGISTPGKNDGELTEWLEDTIIKYAVKNIDGKYYLLATHKVESYKAKARGVTIPTVATQITQREYFYDAKDYTITASMIK